MREVFTGKFYGLKILNGKYEVIKLKNKAANEKSKLETQNEPLELNKEKEAKFEEIIAERTKLRK